MNRFHAFLFFILATCHSAQIWAQAPAASKTAEKELSLFPKGYLSHEALGAELRRLAKLHAQTLEMVSLAKSAGGRDIWLVTLGAPEPKDALKPAILIVANLEADHVAGSQVALDLISKLAKGPWLSRATVYIIPRLNPDGAERVLSARPSLEIRTNLRPIDRDRDGRLSEDGPDDLNGDGIVTRMRTKDPLKATMVPDEKDPRILRLADRNKGEQAVYFEEAEGRDDDGDGLRNEDAPGGVNLNRNWPHRFTEYDAEAGVYPASEPEVFGLIKFAFAHPEIVAVWSLSLNDTLREEPKKPASTLDDADLPLFAELTRVYAKATASKDPPKNISPAGKGSPAPGATTDGALSEWAYHQLGVVGIASRLWSTPEIPIPEEKAAEKPKPSEPAKSKPEEKPKTKEAATIPEDGEARWLYWNDHVLNGLAFVPFKVHEHPTLGKIEIGGWRPGVRLNPPIEQLPPINDGAFAFVKEVIDRLPKLTFPVVKVEAKGDGLFAIHAVVANEGYLPTALAQGVRTRKAPPVLVRLELGEAKMLAGRKLEQIDALAGSGSRHEYRWLIQAPASVKSVRLHVACPKAGSVAKVIELK